MKLLQCSEMPEFGRVFLQLNWIDLLFPESDLILKRKCHSVLLISFTHFITGMPWRWFPVRTAQSQNPEPTIFLACGRNREFWEQPFWNNKGNNRILPIRSHVVCILTHAWNGCSQNSRFLPQPRRIVGSGDENALAENWQL